MLSFRKIRRIDPVFGTMLFMPGKSAYWEASAYFPPVGRQVEFFIDGNAADDLQAQHAFLKEICHRWPDVLCAINAALEADGRPLRAEGLVVSGMSIPKATSFEEAEWDISVDAPNDNGIYTVAMRGMVAQSTTWDC